MLRPTVFQAIRLVHMFYGEQRADLAALAVAGVYWDDLLYPDKIELMALCHLDRDIIETAEMLLNEYQDYLQDCFENNT